jgi:opacity protein-like surface antigen
VSPYLGGGVGYWKWSDEHPPMDAREYPVETEDASGFSIFGMAGFEWGFTECMTLGGEYQLGLENGSSTDEIEYSGDSTTIDEEEWSWMGFSTASVYLSVYW